MRVLGFGGFGAGGAHHHAMRARPGGSSEVAVSACVEGGQGVPARSVSMLASLGRGLECEGSAASGRPWMGDMDRPQPHWGCAVSVQRVTRKGAFWRCWIHGHRVQTGMGGGGAAGICTTQQLCRVTTGTHAHQIDPVASVRGGRSDTKPWPQPVPQHAPPLTSHGIPPASPSLFLLLVHPNTQTATT